MIVCSELKAKLDNWFIKYTVMQEMTERTPDGIWIIYGMERPEYRSAVQYYQWDGNLAQQRVRGRLFEVRRTTMITKKHGPFETYLYGPYASQTMLNHMNICPADSVKMHFMDSLIMRMCDRING